MTPILIENNERESRPSRTREEAAQMLAELRAAYWDLAVTERRQIKGHIAKIAGLQSTLEREWK